MSEQARRGTLDAEDPDAARPMGGQGSGPSAGDVLASERSARADVYAISLVPAEAHVIAPRYSDAIERVRELARRLSVDGWFTSDQTHYVRVANHRSRGDR